MYKSLNLLKINKPDFRVRLEKKEVSWNVLKYLSRNSNLKNKNLELYYLYLYKTINRRSYLRVNNYCLYTSRNKGIVRFTRMSKIFMKLAVRDDMVVGVRRAVW